MNFQLVIIGICIGINLLVIPILFYAIYAQRKTIKAMRSVMSKEQRIEAIEGIMKEME